MGPKNVDESNFIVLLKKKNERALDYVIDNYGGMIKSIVRKHLNCFPDKCGECIDDILLAVWNRIDSFDPGQNSFSGWLAAVSKYKDVDCKRRYYKHLSESPLSGEEPSPYGNPENDALAREISEETQSLLGCLSPEDQKLFWDRYVNGETPEQLAKQENMKISNLYNHLSRGKKKLKHVKEAN